MKFWSFSYLWWHAFRGDDFDQLIAEDIITNFKKTEGVDLYQENKHYNELLKLLKSENWSSLQSTRISLPFIYIDGQTPKHIDVEIDRSKFEQLSRGLLAKCKTHLLKP
jgi:molecular chaperone DnaK